MTRLILFFAVLTALAACVQPRDGIDGLAMARAVCKAHGDC